MKAFKTIFSGTLVLAVSLLMMACQKVEYGTPVEPKLEIADRVEVDAQGGLVEIPLVSSYPWYAATNADWIKMVKYRGQMKLKEKIVIDVQPNPTENPREAGLQIRLMDQLNVDIIVSQKGAAPKPEIN